ncbi:MAG TPA: lipid-binding SYLF domain-containing protein [Steroidobacteraceae bacterium]|nr:lipid-binding SYLF domain-containing protein [Steroidobacteraceae bacterium]
MRLTSSLIVGVFLAFTAGIASADQYSDTLDLFKKAGESASFFGSSYAYAVYPSIGSGALIIGGARGTGRVYVHDQYVGDTSMTQLSVGLQAGGEGYRQIIFFQDQRAFDEFAKGNYEFGADVSATAIQASASTGTGTTGSGSSVGSNPNAAQTTGGYHKGVAVFTIVRGGAMASAAVSGQKFSYTPKGQ